MAAIQQSKMKEYDELVKELDIILNEKRISYAQFALEMGIQTVSFYNRYKLYGFMLEEMNKFVAYAKGLPATKIKCIKCCKEFIPKAKSVKRALCRSCRDELQRRSNASDGLKFSYPSWVESISVPEIKRLVEQEFHIDEGIAFEMSKACSLEEAKSIRSDHWQPTPPYYASIVALMNIKS